VGVAPESFRGLNSLFAADVWVPLMMYPQVFPTPALVQQRRARYFSVVGRLKPGVSMAQAGTAMQAIARNLEREWPNENQGYRLKLIPAAEAALATKTRSAVVNSGELLTIISGLVLLIACVNVANLLLARAAERNKEIAVRLALGASRWRLIRQLLTESAVLALTGGLAGLLVARWARDLLWSLRPPMFNYAAFHLDFDTPVLVYTLGISVFAGMLFGLAPALRATRPNLATDLKERSGRAVPRVGRWNLRSILVIEQVAFSLITLVAAGLFVRSMRSASQIDPGFDAAHLAAIGFNVSDQGYSTARGQEFQRTVLERLSALRSVDGVSLAKDPPLRAQGARTVILRGQDNAAAGGGRITLTNVVWPGYFRTLRIGLMRGRDFSNLDTLESPRVAIVNEAAAAELWPGQDATEKALEFGGENVPVKVVGVVRNATYRDFFEPPPAMIYLSLVQYYFPYGTVYIHSRGKPETALAEARREMAKLDRNLVLVDETLQSTIRETLWAQRLSGQLLGVFGLLALVLSAIGIYGVVSFSVERRLREIGIRMALGATGADVQTMVIGEGMRMVLAGVIAGLAVSLATSHMVKSMLLVVGPRDAFTFVLVPSMLTLVAMLACWLPARRATRVKPAIALREE
jgi:predicted permease